jgi:uncharacterized protein YdeI (YjbR/CyaY-like superfamily)
LSSRSSGRTARAKKTKAVRGKQTSPAHDHPRPNERDQSGGMTKPRFFKTAAAFRAWLDKNHDKATELWLGLRKKGSGLPSVTYKEAVDQALCFGWIDGIAKGIDEISYMQRFTPRTKKSTWSAINIARMAELEALGLVHSAGRTAFDQRDPSRTNQYSFEQKSIALTPAEQKTLRARKKAWAFFDSQPPGYRKQATWWVISAKKQETRQKRLQTLIEDCEAGRKIKPLDWKPKPKTR